MIRIENKTGVPIDTKIIDTDTGNIIKGVRSVAISPFSAKDNGFIQIKLILSRAEVDLVAKEKEVVEEAHTDNLDNLKNMGCY